MATLKQMEKRVPPATRRGLGLWSSRVIMRVIARNLSRPGLKVGSGDLIRSFKHRESGATLQDLRTEIWTTSRYAPTHEFGDIITPRGQMLAWPVKGSPAATPSGKSRYSSPLRQSLPEGQYRFFVRRAKSGKAFLFAKKRGEKGSARPWYHLAYSVYIPPRLRFVSTARMELRSLVTSLVKEYRKIFKSGR